jgi:tRNA(fMet)-specific endonuclease VapC
MTQRYMLDTNIVSHIMQGRDAGLLARLSQIPVGQAVMSSVTLAELEYGLHRKGQPERLKTALFQVLLRVDVLPWDEPVARCYGQLCHSLETQGINLSDFDMMIAAHCVATDTTLVSRDKAFQTVASIEPEKLQPDLLRLEVW